MTLENAKKLYSHFKGLGNVERAAQLKARLLRYGFDPEAKEPKEKPDGKKPKG